MTTCEQCGRSQFEKNRKYGCCGIDGCVIDRNHPICRMYLSSPRRPKPRCDIGEKRGPHQVRLEDLK